MVVLFMLYTCYLIQFTKVPFEWLYKCIQLKERSIDLFTFVLQFSPDLMMVYLYAVYESNSKVYAVIRV